MACDPAELHRIVRDPWKRPEVLRACFYFVGSDLCLGWDTVHPTTVTSFALKLQATSDGLQATSNILAMASNHYIQPTSDGLQPTTHGLQPNRDGLQPNSLSLS